MTSSRIEIARKDLRKQSRDRTFHPASCRFQPCAAIQGLRNSHRHPCSRIFLYHFRERSYHMDLIVKIPGHHRMCSYYKVQSLALYYLGPTSPTWKISAYLTTCSGYQVQSLAPHHLGSTRIIWKISAYVTTCSDYQVRSLAPHYLGSTELTWVVMMMLLFSEATKDSNRENNMMNHRMVHESPGYLCPFCPDREHKCPRPHNLQQYVSFYCIQSLDITAQYAKKLVC